jgi:asparagine synthetase B (glutamine-hydrolysing)
VNLPELLLVDDAPVGRDHAASIDPRVLRGHFTMHLRSGGEHTLIRDPLGVHKLFFVIDGENVRSSSFYALLRREGHEASEIHSVPSGHRIRIRPAERSLSLEKIAGPIFAEDDRDEVPLEVHADHIARALDRTFEGLRASLDDGAPIFVTLSGGLDSTGIAVLAKRVFPNLVGVTFALEGDPAEGSDREAAARVAREIGIELREVVVRREDLLAHIDPALVWGQDWRDFNVHCALVNAAIAEALPEGSIVLTGDGMNELVADYTPVRVSDRTLYGLPRLPPGRLRRFLVSGLDSGDREVGVYARRRVRAIQPYLLCADAYAAIPPRFIGQSDAKQALAKRIFGDRIPEFVYARPKVRAQIGSSERPGGTALALLERGIDQARLAARFRELLDITENDQRNLIRAGFYRFPTRWPEERTS